MSINHKYPFLVLALLVVVGLTPAATPVSLAQTSDITGDWEGKLVIPQGTLRVVFHIAATDSGYAATMDSPDQGALGIPTSSVKVEGESVTIEVAAIGGKYVGTMTEDSTFAGTWSQGPASLPLELSRVSEEESDSNGNMEGESEASSGDDAPYASQDVTFDNTVDGITLAGTLTMPEGEGPHPAIVLITGSGAQDRDETIFGHKPFRAIADHLTRNGIAVLRYDDRGVGQSTGIYAEGTIELFANDAESAVAFLQSREDVDRNKIGMLGHSEGGIVAPMVQQRRGDLAFIVLLAGPALTGKDILLQQAKLILTANGATPKQVEDNTNLQNKLFDTLETDLFGDSLTEELRTLLKDAADAMTEEERAAAGFTESNIELQLLTLTSPWFRHFVFYDPAPALAAIECPTLALFGEKDLQVPSESNMHAIHEIMSSRDESRLEARVLPELNHLFQTATTGSPNEYQSISESISPIALNEISSWIQAQL